MIPLKTNNYNHMKYLLFLFVFPMAFIFSVSCTTNPEKSSVKPNILVLMSDNHYFEHLGCYGDNMVKTPTIDKIAEEGVRFTHAFCASPSCTPARGAMLTGQEIWRLQEGANLWSTLPVSIPTYQDILEKGGYFTGHDRKGWGPGDIKAGGRDKNPAGTTFNNFTEFLDNNSENKPWSFFFSSKKPHRPFEYGAAEKAGLNIDSVIVPPYMPDSREVRSDICDYYNEIMNFDKQVAEALQIIENRGMTDNTIVVVCADNGWMMPRGLANLYDFGTQVPLIISWPKEFAGNRVVSDFLSLNDLAPTFLDFAGEDVPAEMTARSLKNLLTSNKEGRINKDWDRIFMARERHAMVRKEGLGYPGRAIRTDDFLYIKNHEPNRWPAGDPPLFGDIDLHMLQKYSPAKEYMMEHRNDPAVKPLFEQAFMKRPEEELFDLKKDPFQMNNVAYSEEYREIKKMLVKQLTEYLVKTEAPRETGGEVIWDNSEYFKEADWIGKPRKEAQEKFGLKAEYSYR
jgi:N-sulfoglucosamine sulfohydrolase